MSILALGPFASASARTPIYGACPPSLAWTSALRTESTPLSLVLMTVMAPPRVRSATAKNSAMAIAAGLIWRAIFVFIRIRFYLFLRKILPGVAKIFETRIFVADYTDYGGSRHNQKQKETIEQHRVYRVVAHAAAH